MILNTRWLACIILLMITQVIYSQDSSIEFLSEENTSAIIYKPIDGGYNLSYPTDTIELKKNELYTYHVKIDDWALVQCKILKNNPNVFIEKNNTVRIINTKQGITFKGDNAASNNYLYLFILEELKAKALIDSIFETKDQRQINKILTNPRSLLRNTKVIEKIDSMYANKQITSTCYDFLNKELDYALKSKLSYKLDECLYYSVINDSTYNYYTDKIMNNILIEHDKIRSLRESIFSCRYYSRLYDQLDNNIKEHLTAEYNKNEMFGPYIYFLLAPGKTQLNMLFDALIHNYQRGSNEFNRLKMYNFMSQKYPQSESVQILKKFVEEEARDTIPIKTIFIDSASIKSFSDIQQLEAFKGKYIFIDVWASWCMPCREEFAHNKQLNAMLDQYPNLEKLYISVDGKEENWKKAIESMRISGHHLQASTDLSDYLRKEVYQSGRITVPRYILIDNNGKIIYRDMPRPSSMKQLKAELDKHLK